MNYYIAMQLRQQLDLEVKPGTVGPTCPAVVDYRDHPALAGVLLVYHDLAKARAENPDSEIVEARIPTLDKRLVDETPKPSKSF